MSRRVPVRQWVLSFPIPLRLLFATHPDLLVPVLQIVHRIIATFLIQQTGLQRTEAHTGAVTLIRVSARPPISTSICIASRSMRSTSSSAPSAVAPLKIIAAIEHPHVIAKILKHLGLPARAPPRAAARPFDQFQLV
ncbi:MAG: hypothetical protein M3495_21010 [Pseudomonadota bacterium]|nr:hypothetical protein [Gammaproteobacteria bacterium]MDQ3583920.1 hypothetical protein [Pseudomonadota bacterium]